MPESSTSGVDTEHQETPPPKARGFDPRDYLPSTVLTIWSIVIALLIGAVLIAISDHDVISTAGNGDIGGLFGALGSAIGGSYWALLNGAVGSWDAISGTLEKAAPLVCAGLGVTVAFRAGLFNIGAQGQLILGAILGGWLGFGISAPPGLHLLLVLVGTLVGGALWGALSGFLKARTGAHEVITTIMLNYVAASLLLYLLGKDAFQRPNSINPQSPPIDDSAAYPHVFSTHVGVILPFLATVLVWWLLNRTTLGFQLRASGSGPDAARTAGMNVPRLYIVAMALAGALAGLAASMQIQGQHLSLSTSFGGSLGFDAITVSLLGRGTPVGTLLAGLLFGALQSGGTQMEAAVGTQPQLTEVLQALIVLFVAAPALVRWLTRARGADADTKVQAMGWGS